MPPAVTRELEITYAGVTIGGSSATYLLTDKYRMTLAYARGSVDAEVIVVSADEATFASDCQALENAFRTPRGVVLIKCNTTTLRSFSHSANTGFNGDPSIAKIGDGADTVRSRHYRISLSFEMPADLSGQSGRRDSTVTLTKDASRRRTLTIAGIYTALSSNAARAQYDASIDAYQTSLISSVGGGATYKMIREDASNDDADKNLSFTRVLQEVFYGATSSNLDHPSIIDHRITFVRTDPFPGDSPGKSTKRLATVQALFDANVDHTAATDPNSLYTAVESWMIAQVQAKFSPSATAVTSGDRNLDMTANRLTVSLGFAMSISGGRSLAYDSNTEVYNVYGTTLIPVWNGDPLAKHEFQGPARRIRVKREIETVLGVVSVTDDGKVGGTEPSFAGGNWKRIDRRSSAHPREIGIGSGRTIKVTDLVAEITEEWANKPSGGSGGPITSPGTGPGGGGQFQSPGGAVTPGLRGGGVPATTSPDTAPSRPPTGGRTIGYDPNRPGHYW